MPTKTVITATCDECGVTIVYNGSQTTGYITLANQIMSDASGIGQPQLANLVPSNVVICSIACLNKYTPPTTGATNVSTSAG
jgi:hypothetical protein